MADITEKRSACLKKCQKVTLPKWLVALRMILVAFSIRRLICHKNSMVCRGYTKS